MWKQMTLILPFMIAVSTVQAGSIEREPFHVSHFRGDVTVSLTVTSLNTSRILDYDFYVTISLTQSTVRVRSNTSTRELTPSM